MSRARRLPLLLVVVVALVATGVVTTLQTATNPSQLPSGLSVLLKRRVHGAVLHGHLHPVRSAGKGSRSTTPRAPLDD